MNKGILPKEFGDHEGNRTPIDLIDSEVHYQSDTWPLFSEIFQISNFHYR